MILETERGRTGSHCVEDWLCKRLHVMEGRLEERIEVTRRRGRRGTQLVYDQNETR